jgi:pyruvyl transferase EpsI
VKWFERFEEADFPFRLVAFCDADTKKQGTKFLGREILGPEHLAGLDYDYLLISSPLVAKEATGPLAVEYSVPREKILRLDIFDEMAEGLSTYGKTWPHWKSRRLGERKVYLFCAPDYGNLGDHAIARSEVDFFIERFGVTLTEIEMHKFDEMLPFVRRGVAPTDLILITGGGFLGSLWGWNEAQARKVVEVFPNNPIVILPQTLFWEDVRHCVIEREKTAAVYAAHSDLTLCARDKETYRLMRETYSTCRVLLVPDMALSSCWEGFFDEEERRCGALLCLKTNKGSILADCDFAKLEAIGVELCGSSFECDTDMKDQVMYPFERNDYLREKFAEFRRAKLVITDRLHGLIFASISGTPCVALNNCDHKLRASFEWVRHLPYVKFANSLDNVEVLVKEVLAVGPGKYDMATLQPHFDELEAVLKEKMGGNNK